MSVPEARTESGAHKAPRATDPETELLPERTTVEPQAGPEETAVLPAVDADARSAEEPEDPAVARERRRAERDRALGTRRPAPAPVVEEEPARTPPDRVIVRNTDRFLGSLGLFLLRLVTAGIIGLHGFAKALDIGSVQAMLADTIIPEPVIMSYVLTGVEVAIALALLFGVLTRVAGFGLAVIGIASLVFVHWTTNPFVGNVLTGELELLLSAVGLTFLFVGAGGWSVDAAFRRRRAAESA